MKASELKGKSASELAAMEREAAVAERQAQQEIEALFTRLCPGRCELIDVRAIVGEPRAVGEVTPGFDGEGATGSYTVELQRLEVQYLIDSTLPKAFMSNMPRMLSFRLQRITPDVRVTPIPLEFPRPQAPLMPEIEEEPDMGPPPKIEEEPDMAPAPPKVEEPEPEEEPKVSMITEKMVEGRMFSMVSDTVQRPSPQTISRDPFPFP